MCAIFGIVGEYESKSAKSAFSKMAHRGPDFCDIIEQKELFFAHHRLSIVDSHHRSNQPFVYKNILLSFNGEIYNFQELKAKTPFAYKTDSDTEVIMALYLQYGEAFVKHLRGMFAIAIWDSGKLLLYRDRLGKKPLFYYHDNKRFIFASELKAIKPFLAKYRLNQDAMLSYLSFLAPTTPHTFYEGVYKLGVGEYLKFEDGHVDIKRYHNLLEQTPNAITNKDEAVSLLEQKLFESIDLRFSQNLPNALLLSGGIDSATIAYFANKQKHNFQTYSLGFREFSKYSELEAAKESATLLGVLNRAVVATKERFIEAMDQTIELFDEPLNDPAAIPLNILLQEVKKDGYKIVVSGEGSDELFLGYRQYFEYIELEKAKELYHANWLKKYFRSNFSMHREWEWYKRAFEKEVIFRCSSEKFTDMQLNILMRQNIKDGHNMRYIQSFRNAFEASQHCDETIWYSFIDLHHFQAEHFLAKLDRVSMANSLEARTPFLDHELVELIFRIDPKLRYMEKSTKVLLKNVMQNYLPQKILARKKKGFSNPYIEYLIASQKIELIKKVNEQTGLFKTEILERYLQKAHKGTFKQHIWALYVLSWWIKRDFL